VKAEQVHRLHEALNDLALSWMQTRGEGLLVEPEALVPLSAINHDLWSASAFADPVSRSLYSRIAPRLSVNA